MKRLLLLIVAVVGSFQVIGHLTGSLALRGLGLISGIAPYPKVFCEADGYEPFAASFHLTGTDPTGKAVTIPLDRHRYALLQGPYLRRNAYGAALAYAPRLPEKFRSQVLLNLKPLLHELDLPQLENPVLTITPRAGETPAIYHFPLTSAHP